jgi:hypothetical protein
VARPTTTHARRPAPAPAVAARASALRPLRSNWVIGVVVAMASAFIVVTGAAIVGGGDPPLLPASPLAIPIEAMPTAVKVRHLTVYTSIEDVDSKRERPLRPAANRRDADARFYGSLVIDSTPINARAFVNGHAVGTTPLVLTDVPAGSRVVRLEADDYTPWSSTVRVIADQRISVNVTLAPSR